MPNVEKISSGIEGFDIVSMGGIPKYRTTLISGTPGSGKTIFCTQFLVNGITQFNESGVFVTFEESPQDIIQNMRDFGWDIPKYQESGRWEFVDVSPHFEDNYEITGDYDLSGLIIRIKTAVEKIGAKRIVLDSLAALFTQFPDASLIRKEILRLKSCLNSLSVTTLITSERYEDYTLNSHYNVIDFVSDNMVILKNTSFNEFRRRTIEILKYRGAAHKKGQYSFTIKDNRGIVIISFKRTRELVPHERKRKPSGMDDLDLMIDGGFFKGSSILISGQTGTGKTLLLLSMIDGILKRGERCILFNFEEGREQILKKAHNWNIDLEKAEQDGLFKLQCLYPESTGIEDLVVDIKTAINDFSPDRLFIDSISAIERITTEITFRESLINIILYFREMNLIGFLTSTTPTFTSPALGSGTHISTLSDAIILLLYFEREGKLIRGMAIMKMRDSDHSKSFMEYQIDDTGIHILEPIKQNAGIFS